VTLSSPGVGEFARVKHHSRSPLQVAGGAVSCRPRQYKCSFGPQKKILRFETAQVAGLGGSRPPVRVVWWTKQV